MTKLIFQIFMITSEWKLWQRRTSPTHWASKTNTFVPTNEHRHRTDILYIANYYGSPYAIAAACFFFSLHTKDKWGQEISDLEDVFELQKQDIEILELNNSSFLLSFFFWLCCSKIIINFRFGLLFASSKFSFYRINFAVEPTNRRQMISI